MQAITAFIVSTMLLTATPAAAANPKWEDCLDKGDFSYDEYLGGLSGSKAGCKFTFSRLEGKGEKLVVNVCNPGIVIEHHATLDASARKVFAGTGGCPSPGFGADFSENAKDLGDFQDLRTRVFEMLKKIRASYEMDEVRTSSVPFDQHDSTSRLWCANFLLSEYLKRCLPFEEKKGEATVITKEPNGNLLQGIHPQTIKK